MVLWAVITPLVFFLVLVPGYVVATYLKHRISKENLGSRLLKHGTASNYTVSRSSIGERLQARNSLNVPTSAKQTTTKHLRSLSAYSYPTKPFFLKPLPVRKTSSPTSILVTPQHKPDIVETYSPYQMETSPELSSEDKSSEENSPNYGLIKKGFDTNNNGKREKRNRHLIHSPNPFYQISTVVVSKKCDPLMDPRIKTDFPEILDKP